MYVYIYKPCIYIYNKEVHVGNLNMVLSLVCKTSIHQSGTRKA